MGRTLAIIDAPGDTQGVQYAALTGGLLNASMEIRADRIIQAPSVFYGRHFKTNIKTLYKTIDGQVYFALIAPTRILVLSTVAATVTQVSDGVWDTNRNCFTGLETGGKRAIVANTLAEVTPSGQGLLIETSAGLGATDYIKLFIEGYAR